MYLIYLYHLFPFNIMLQNARMFDAINEVSGESGVLAHANQVAESIGVHIDINDRAPILNHKELFALHSWIHLHK